MKITWSLERWLPCPRGCCHEAMWLGPRLSLCLRGLHWNANTLSNGDPWDVPSAGRAGTWLGFAKFAWVTGEIYIEKYCRWQRMLKVTELGRKIKVKAEEYKICISAEDSNKRHYEMKQDQSPTAMYKHECISCSKAREINSGYCIWLIAVFHFVKCLCASVSPFIIPSYGHVTQVFD